MNVAGVSANVLEKPKVASRRLAKDTKFAELEALKKQGKLQALFRGAVPPEGQTLKEEFEQKHQNWHDRAMHTAKPQIGGISGHTLGYMNLYSEALNKTPAEQRGQYPTQERLRAIMLAGLIGAKRHHSYDEVMSASTGAGKGTSLSPRYRGPASYIDVLESRDPAIRKCARDALEKAQDRYLRESHTVLKTITKSLDKLSPEDAPARTQSLTAAVGEYLKGLGRYPDSQVLATAVAASVARPPVAKVAQDRPRSPGLR